MARGASWHHYQKSFGAWMSAAKANTSTFLHTLSCFYVFSRYGLFVSKVTGPSMRPTFGGQGDYVVAEAVTPMWGDLKPASTYVNTITTAASFPRSTQLEAPLLLISPILGDIVICARPVDPAESIIKRVVALEGDEVVLYPDRESSEVRRVKVPPGHVWIQGDNLTQSLDSRQYGAVPRAMVRGRVIFQGFLLCWQI
ncbi:hypothetical protein VOLCADRAFT_87856 [Volvox carteri f. nagariensis]|uniref:Peptidase S26 domain-containing protein n=1 Tax=Volvox carteri f. nagariensis TaxID=3068 RepID=D8TMF1_VOLCA|nr:uncharacterized protein VOLCADRAFT_87856 [Volvox carteri f. nagariensis]EFJ51243.1 hypothetical protein VOLCADRAFT_87856 [Volvox carteri f. nagariensis]|eukprot:XP_002947710.1 hypothetical protein VOLCADRAFT_87856 [Volvox carteri f. nagariensis]